MKKIAFIFGTRPEAIKMLPVIKTIKLLGKDFEPIVIATAQHRDILDQMLKLFDIEPDFDLNLMKANQSIETVISHSLEQLKKIIQSVTPDLVLVQGDTASTFSGAFAAFLSKVPVGHIEAGLRTHDKFQPFPEEVLRKMVTAIADLHFAPTENAKANLIREGISEKAIFVTGNTVIDALLTIIKKKYRLSEHISKILEKKRRVILVTSHRRENFGLPIKQICHALNKICELCPDIDVIFSVHPNPNIKAVVQNTIQIRSNIHLIDPLEYIGFVHLMKNSYLILTDSGGIQEEAPSLGKPVLVLRNKTERPEAIEFGTAKLIGTDTDLIISETMKLINDNALYKKISEIRNPYGDGNASKRIVSEITKFFNDGKI